MEFLKGVDESNMNSKLPTEKDISEDCRQRVAKWDATLASLKADIESFLSGNDSDKLTMNDKCKRLLLLFTVSVQLLVPFGVNMPQTQLQLVLLTRGLKYQHLAKHGTADESNGTNTKTQCL